MTRQEYAELIAGEKQIQRERNVSDPNNWYDVHWEDVDPCASKDLYRHKPEPKYRPYTVKEMLYIITESRENRRGYPVFVDKSDNEQVFLIAVNNDSLVGKRFDNVYIFITFRDFLTDCQWTNGAICGIEVTE